MKLSQLASRLLGLVVVLIGLALLVLKGMPGIIGKQVGEQTKNGTDFNTLSG